MLPVLSDVCRHVCRPTAIVWAACRARRVDAGPVHELQAEGDTNVWRQSTKIHQLEGALEAYHLVGWHYFL